MIVLPRLVASLCLCQDCNSQTSLLLEKKLVSIESWFQCLNSRYCAIVAALDPLGGTVIIYIYHTS